MLDDQIIIHRVTARALIGILPPHLSVEGAILACVASASERRPVKMADIVREVYGTLAPMTSENCVSVVLCRWRDRGVPIRRDSRSQRGYWIERATA